MVPLQPVSRLRAFITGLASAFSGTFTDLRFPALRILLAIVVWLFLTTAARTAELQKLHGHVPAAAAHLAPAGQLNGAAQLNLAVALPLRNQAGLTTLLQDLYNPKSPNYRKFLTPAQFTAQFGPTDADYQAVVQFARANHLTISNVHPNRVILDLKGAVGDIQKALHVTLRTYNHPTEKRQFFAPDAEPSLDLTVPIAHISGLDNYALPKPRFVRNAAVAHNNSAPPAQPDIATPSVGSGPNGGYMGGDFRAAYAPGTSLNGTGQTIGLLQFDGYTTSDITYYESAAGLPNVTLTNVLLDGFDGTPTGNGGEVEVSLDIEMSMSMAPGISNIIVYEAGPNGLWHDILNRMATDNLAKQLSCSWYIPNGTEDTVADGIFQEMATQGQTFFSASGDLDAYTGLIPFPGDTPYITEVGGTTLTTNTAGGPWSSETVWNWGLDNGEYVGSGGGISTQYPIPIWQQGVSMATNQGSTTMRNVPDVALTADNVYVRADAEDQSVGGTSCAAPLWAGFTALVNQQAAAYNRPAVGFLNPAVYAIGTGTGYNSAFNDTTTGNNFSASSPAKFAAVSGYDLCTGWGTPTGTALINALTGPPDILIVSGTDLSTVGAAGGPFAPASTTYTLNNTGTATINWTAWPSQPWLTVSPSSGTLAPNAQTTFTVSPNSAANSLTVGSYSASLTVTDTTTGVAQSRTEVLNVLGPPSLAVSPSTPFAAFGNPGGPFAPSSVTYTLTNTGAPAMNWTASNSSAWLSLSSTGGTLAAGASTTVTASITSAANTLGLGTYTDTINFTNSTNGTGNTSVSASLNISNQVLVPIPPQTTTYAGWVRGYWFTVPASFVITGLEVPTDASTGAQSIAVLKLTSTPPFYPTTTNTFTTLFLTQNNSTAGTIPVNIPVNQGDIIGILGERAEVNSYGTAPYVTQILGQSVALSRLGMEFTLDTNPPQSVWTDSSTPSLGRVNMYITGNSSEPIITSPFSTNANVGQPFSYTITATNSPTSFSANGLPAGLNVNSSTGVISGMPTAAGTSTVTIGATNASGTGTATLTINVLPPAPVITSPLTASGSTSLPFSYTITATNSPTSFAASGLPSGLTLNATTGVIGGTPAAAGTSNITISATNAGGTASATLVLTVTLGSPVITSSLTATATLSNAFSYSITASSSPASFNATGLPAGLSVNTSTGLISGTPTALGTSNVSISATNSVGTGSATLVLTVASAPPVITSSTYVTGAIGSPFTYTITATNNPTSYNATGLPTGLGINTSTGVISGTPTATGYTYPTISATNAGGTGSASLEIYISPPPPVITSPATASGTVNVPFSFTVTATGSPYEYTASGLPSGWSINSSTGVISGMPTAAGTTTVTVGAVNDYGSASGSLVITIAPATTPIITSRTSVTGAINAPFSYSVTAINSPTSFGAAGLPAGLSINTSTGVITGTPAATGTNTVAVSATNSYGTSSALVSLTFWPTPPAATTAFYFDGATGSLAGIAGGSGLDTPSNGFTFSLSGTNTSSVFELGVSSANSQYSWSFDVAPPSGVPLSLGTYLNAMRWPFQASNQPGFSITVYDEEDNTLLADFNVLDVQYGSGGAVTSLAIDFVQYEEEEIPIWNIGSYRYNSTVPLSYPAPPAILSATAAPGSTTSEVFTATVNPAGPPTTVYFQYGPTSTYGSTTPSQSLAASVIGAPVTATISGLQPATLYHYQLVATSSWGTSTSADATFTTGSSAPVIFSPASTTISQYEAFTYQTVASNTPTSYSASGLPTGLSINSSTGLVSGSVSQPGVYSFTLQATNASGTGSATLTLNVVSPQPAITSPLTASGNTNVSFTYAIAATNAPTSFNATGLPAGLSVNTSTGLISGTPTGPGTSNITISATNAYGTGTATLVLTVTTIPPVITSSTYISATVNTPVNYAITATNNPTSYNATGLPPGMSVNTSTGVISGTPTTAGVTVATISATNAGGTGSATLEFNIVPLPPVITSALTASAGVGSPFSYTITATNNPTSYYAPGLPTGLSWNSSTGVISGTPTTAGTSNVTISASNAGGTGSATLVLTVAPQGVPVITSSLSATATVNAPFSYTITASGSPTSYNATGLPAGLSVNTSTGVISGTPITLGTSNITISATNSVGTGSATLVFTVAVAKPVITSALTASGTVSAPFTYTITATNSPTSYNATGLPAGLGVNGSTGVISGTPTTAGTSNVTISATNAGGTGTATLTITIFTASSFPGFLTTGSMSVSRLYHTTTLLGNGKVLAAGGYNAGVSLATAEVYDPSAGTWTLTGSLNTSRYSATATLLPNGNVLVAGGDGFGGALASAELYDPTTGTWTVTGSLNTARYDHTAVLLANGQVLVAGGINSSSAIATAEIYNPETGTWSAINPMNTARYFGGAALLPSGQVLVAGGGLGSTVTADAEIYDPVAGTWTTINPMPTASLGHSLTLLPNGTVLCAGGVANGNSFTTAEIFNPTTGSWTATGSMTNERCRHAASLLPNGMVLVAGGGNTNGAPGTTAELYNYQTGAWSVTGSLNATRELATATLLPNGEALIVGGGTAVTEIYEYATGTWSATGSLANSRELETLNLLPTGKVLAAGGYNGAWLASSELYDPVAGTWSSTGNLITGRTNAASVLLDTGNVLVLGGYNGSTWLTDTELYNPTSGAWTQTGNLNFSRTGPAATLLANGTALAVGGYSSTGGYLAYTEVYNPASATWTVTGNLTYGREMDTVTLLPNGEVLVAGGYGNSGILGSAEIYNPSTGTWTTTGNLNTARQNHTATLLPNGLVLVAGGTNQANLASAELYNPATGTWTATGSLNTARYQHTATLLPNGKVLVMGGIGSAGYLTSAELYDPATGTWRSTASLLTSRYYAAATLLPTGKVLIAGGYSNAYLTESELYDPGLGFSSAWQPAVTSATSPLQPGASLVLSGSGFNGISGASTGSFVDSPTNYPIVRLSALASGQTTFLFSNPSANWSNTSFTSVPVTGFPYGYALATVFTNGIPSNSALVNIQPSSNASLSNLVLSTGTLTPAFSNATTSYTVAVPYATSTIAVTPTASGASSTITINGVAVASGSASQAVSLPVGATTLTVAVTAQDGVTTQPYTVTVTRDDTVITTQSGTQNAPAGGAATFSVSVTGTGPFTYQWYFNGAAVQNATGASYTMNNITSNNAGNYWVVVTNPYGVTTSNAYTLTVTAGVPSMPPWGWLALPALLLIVVTRLLPRVRPSAD